MCSQLARPLHSPSFCITNIPMISQWYFGYSPAKQGCNESHTYHAVNWCELYRIIPRSALSLHSRWMGGEERPKRRESPLFWRSNRRTLSHAHTHHYERIINPKLTRLNDDGRNGWLFKSQLMASPDKIPETVWVPGWYARQFVQNPTHYSPTSLRLSVSLPQRKWLYAAGNYPKMTMRKGSAEIGEALRQARRHLANSGKESQITTKSWLSSSSSQSRPWSRTRNIWGPIWLIHSPILFTCY